MQSGNKDQKNQQINFGGLPAHMDDSQKIIISGQRKHRSPTQNDLVLHREGQSMFAEKMTSIIGPSYVLAFFAGGAYGLTKIPPPQARRTTRLLVNNYLNNIGKTSSRFGNNTGAAIFLYLLVGKSIDFVFKEELETLSDEYKSALFGLFTGLIYKSTRGFRPACFAGVLGAVCGSAYSYAWQKGNLRPVFM